MTDTLFRHGSGNGAEFIQNAANAALPKNEQIDPKGGFGSQTYAAIQKIASDPQSHRTFLDELKTQREQDSVFTPDEARTRMEFFRFPAWRPTSPKTP